MAVCRKRLYTAHRLHDALDDLVQNSTVSGVTLTPRPLKAVRGIGETQVHALVQSRTHLQLAHAFQHIEKLVSAEMGLSHTPLKLEKRIEP